MKNRLLTMTVCAALVAVPAMAREDGRFEETLEVGSAVELEVATDAGAITVHAGEDGQVRVVASIQRSRSWLNTVGMDKVRRVEQDPPIEHRGSHIRIGRMLKGYDLKGLAISYEIWTPPNTRLRSECDSGGQTIEGIAGPVYVKCDSGGIQVRDVGGDVTIEVDSGRIEADGVDGAFVARTDSGGIDAKGIRGRIDVSADSGGVRIEQLAPGDIQASADSGGVRVWIPEGAGYDLTASTDSGGIEVEPEMTVSGVMKKNRVEGKIAGGGHQLRLRTDSGGIRIFSGPGEI